MTALNVILLVVFIIVCVLLVLLVLVQDDEKGGMGGLLGGSSTVAFGGHSASVLTKATRVFVFLFMILAFGLAFMNKKSGTAKEADRIAAEAETAVEETVEKTEEKAADWWKEAEAPKAE